MRSNEAMARVMVARLTRIVLVGERLGEHALVARVGAQAIEELVLPAGEAELDRLLAEHRHQRLVLERRSSVGIRPRQGRRVGDVGEAHRAARVRLAGRADRLGAAVGEGLSCWWQLAHA